MPFGLLVSLSRTTTWPWCIQDLLGKGRASSRISSAWLTRGDGTYFLDASRNAPKAS